MDRTLRDQYGDRHPIRRAWFAFQQADKCTTDQRECFEFLLESLINFARMAVTRLEDIREVSLQYAQWWKSNGSDASIEFFRQRRNPMWHDLQYSKAPLRINQKLGNVAPPGVAPMAKHLYYFEDVGEDALETVSRHLKRVDELVLQVEIHFAPEIRQLETTLYQRESEE